MPGMCAMTAPGAPWPGAVIHDMLMRNIGPAPVIYGKFSPAPASNFLDVTQENKNLRLPGTLLEYDN